ncbi:hypothetical protein SDC9_91264 [bioreactor metagenome]|uniref:Uncharacterized protein n=1 Tax=bioreactor metagenome TaxID=1076179 RepID=A0A644ZUM3_9ZZZZ
MGIAVAQQIVKDLGGALAAAHYRDAGFALQLRLLAQVVGAVDVGGFAGIATGGQGGQRPHAKHQLATAQQKALTLGGVDAADEIEAVVMVIEDALHLASKPQVGQARDGPAAVAVVFVAAQIVALAHVVRVQAPLLLAVVQIAEFAARVRQADQVGQKRVLQG